MEEKDFADGPPPYISWLINAFTQEGNTVNKGVTNLIHKPAGSKVWAANDKLATILRSFLGQPLGSLFFFGAFGP